MTEFEETPEDGEDADEAPSKSQRKRDALALQSMGERLVALPATVLERIPLDDSLLDSVVAARSMRKSAYRRQIRFVARLLRDADLEPITTALDALSLSDTRAAAALHRLERARDSLIAEGDEALGTLAETVPDLDRQRVRQLVRQARRESAAGQPPKAARALFRYLREHLERPE